MWMMRPGALQFVAFGSAGVSTATPKITQLDCSADLARRLLSNPIGQPWGHCHAILVVATEVNAFMGRNRK